MTQRYLIALGSNVRHPRHGQPATVLGAACTALAEAGLVIEAASPIIASAPLGPSNRRYANAVVVVRTPLPPPQLLSLLKRIEWNFGRRPRGRRWGSRVLDLDIVLWQAGHWRSRGLTIPHPAFRNRSFVLGPARTIAPHWRDPQTGLAVRHLYARLTRPLPLPRAGACTLHPSVGP